MSIGFAIFLSALVFASLILYGITRDRWNWRRGGRAVAIGVGSLLLISTLVLVSWWVYRKIEEIPRPQTAYADLRLGMKTYEVKYVKGYPPAVVGPTENGGAPIIETKNLKDGDSPEHYLEWHYPIGDQGSYLAVTFDKEKKLLISIECYANSEGDCPPLLRVDYGDSEEEVVQKLGKPSDQWIETDSGTKQMNYKALNIRIYLSMKKAYMFEVRSL